MSDQNSTVKNEAMLLVDIEKFEKREIPMPVCAPDQVVVKTEHVSICHSDVGFFTDYGDWIKNKEVKLPVIIGHEVAGVVYEVGSEVKHLKVGDRVAIEPGIPCGHCELCKSGRYNLCPDVRFMAAPPHFNGALRRYIEWPASYVFKLPDNVSTLEGALLEPLAVGLHATNRAGVCLGSSVVIVGAGSIGFTLMLSSLARGAAKVIMIDIYDNRLEKAMEMGAYGVVNSTKEDPVEKVKELLDGDLADFVFESAGIPETFTTATDLVRTAGTIGMVGSIIKPTWFQPFKLIEKEVKISTSFRYANIYPTALNAVASGKIDVKQLVTNYYDFEESQRAFHEVHYNARDIIKGVIKF